MKKFIFILMTMFMSCMSMSAQTVESSRFFDNWSVGLKGGMTTPLNHAAFWGDARPIVGVELEKGITPIVSVAAEGAWTVNTSPFWLGTSNGLVFDRQYVGGLAKVNLMNAIGGYLGTPRLFEVKLVGGLGWQHDYVKWNEKINSWYTKWGLDLNFNLGENKVWTVGLKPDVVFDMNDGKHTRFNRNLATFEMWATVVYHFKNRNQTHSFVLCDKKYTQEEFDELNWEVNRLRCELDECNSREPKIVVQTVEIIKEVPVTKVVVEDVADEFPTIKFLVNSARLSNDNLKALEWTANELNKCSNSVVITGYASEEGNCEFNKNLSLRRAQAVADALVNFGVDKNRLTVVGGGATSKFGSSRAANRIVITKK